MMEDKTLNEIESAFGRSIVESSSVSGGDINQAFRLGLEDGRDVFVKTHAACPGDFFAAEAEGLRALGAACPLKVPEVLAVGQEWLALEWLSAARPGRDYDEVLAAGLAEMHAKTAPCFGFEADNYCGSSVQLNSQCDDGYEFFAEYRLLAQTRMARDAGLLGSRHVRQLESLCDKLQSLIPAQAPTVVHGDLWAGNAMAYDEGAPALIDPACYWGWPESDLAMMSLFGGFSAAVFEHYQAIRPLEKCLHERLPLYNTYHLLNHLNLFGSAYLRQLESVLDQFTR